MPAGSSYGGHNQDPRRRVERHKAEESITCDLGNVIDLSTAGLRVAGSGKPPLQTGQSGQIKLTIPEGVLAVHGRVVWSRRTGFRRFEMGIEFQNVKRSVTAALDSLARFGFLGFGDGSKASTGSGGTSSNKPQVQVTMDLPDYYAILGVDSEASDSDLREAFRAQARKWHPDVTDDPNGEERFIQLNEAYDFLKDPVRRRVYDVKRAS